MQVHHLQQNTSATSLCLATTYTDNMALSGRYTPGGPAVQQSINISCPPAHSSKPGLRMLLLLAHVGIDRSMNARQLHRSCSAYYAGSANNWLC